MDPVQRDADRPSAPTLWGGLDEQDLIGWVDTGQLIPLETERHGLDALPGAISGLFRGEDIGKMIVALP